MEIDGRCEKIGSGKLGGSWCSVGSGYLCKDGAVLVVRSGKTKNDLLLHWIWCEKKRGFKDEFKCLDLSN